MGTKFIDFAAVIERASIEQIAEMLQLNTTQKNKQLRCRCPVHGGENSLAITPDKMSRGKHPSLGVFYCQAAEEGGDRIGLVAHIMQCGQNEAAHAINDHFGGKPAATAATVPSTLPRAVGGQEHADRLRKVAEALQPVHEEVQKLGIEPDVATEWGIGWKGSGTMPARVLFPIRDRHGVVHGYCGLSDTKQPRWMLPPNLDPEAFIFGADRIEEGEVSLVADPLKVVLRSQGGMQAACFLTETASALQAEMWAALLAEKKCEWSPT